jgi:hypothetical protein
MVRPFGRAQSRLKSEFDRHGLTAERQARVGLNSAHGIVLRLHELERPQPVAEQVKDMRTKVSEDPSSRDLSTEVIRPRNWPMEWASLESVYPTYFSENLLWITQRAIRLDGCQRRTSAIASSRPVRSAAATIRSASDNVRAIGFSQRTARPGVKRLDSLRGMQRGRGRHDDEIHRQP